MPYNEVLAKRLRAKLKQHPGLVEKKLFGGIGFLVRGNMACGVHQDDLILRLGNHDFGEALKKPAARIFDLYGRTMEGWVLISAAGYNSDAQLEGWIKKSLALVESLPPKRVL